MFFDGSHKGAKGKPKRPPRGKPGKPAGGANGVDLVAQARQDREKRKQEKLQRNSARAVQSAVRSFLAREAARQMIRAAWDEQAAGWAETAADGGAGMLSADVIGAFMFFYTPRKDAARAQVICQLMGQLLKGDWLTQLAADPELPRYELLLRRLLCAFLPRAPGAAAAAAAAAAGAASTLHADPRAATQAAEVVLTLTDADRWCKAGFDRERAGFICWGMLRALTAAGIHEEAAAFLRAGAVHLPLLISVIGLSLRPVFLSAPRTPELDECRLRFCSSVLCVPNLAESAPSAMAAVFHRPRLWDAVLPVLAEGCASAVLPVAVAHVPAVLGNLIDLAASTLDGGDIGLVASFFTVLSCGLPHVFSQPVHDRSSLFETEDDDDDGSIEPEPAAGGDAKRYRMGGGQQAMVAVQDQLEALMKPATIGPVIQAAFADAGDETTSAALHVCFAVEWILRASPSRLSPHGPRRGVLDLIAFQSGSKALLVNMWKCLTDGSAFELLQEGLLSGATSAEIRMRRSTLILFCECYSHLLTTQDDEEFFVKQNPFSLDEVQRMTSVLRDVASEMYLSTDMEDKYMTIAPADVAATRHLLASITHLLRRVFTRDSRRSFCEPSHWVSPGARANNEAMVASVVDTNDANHSQWQRLCRQMPYAVPFESRVRVFHERVRRDRGERQGGPDDRGTMIRVRRDHLFEDALEQVGTLGENIKSRLRVQFVDVHGIEEAGIDGGGLFKEFMHELVRTAFGPDYALFKSTPGHMLYPNPGSDILGPQHLQHFRFLGLIVGKALYEGCLIELPLAGFFLSKVLGQFNFVDDLPSLDEELYRNLMFLKTYDGDCDDLGLNFAIVNSEYDETRVTELMPNGKDIAVTNENRIHYIHRVANYRLNHQIKRQSAAFLDGLREIIPMEWFQMFSETELQQVISGTRGGIDIENLKLHTNYSGGKLSALSFSFSFFLGMRAGFIPFLPSSAGYNAGHPVIELFWHVVSGLSTEQQSSLLQFATSSDRVSHRSHSLMMSM